LSYYTDDVVLEIPGTLMNGKALDRAIRYLDRSAGSLAASEWTGLFRLETPFHHDDVPPEDHILRDDTIRKSGRSAEDASISTS
jgi:hypothetical protein